MNYFNKTLPYPNQTFYSTYEPGYNLDNYEAGCGLRKKRRIPSSQYYQNANRKFEDSPCCSYMKERDRNNMYKKCCCSLRYQPACECECYKMPSLFHKLLSAPYTKKKNKSHDNCCKKSKNLKNKQTQTENTKENENQASRNKFFIQQQPVPTQILYHQIPQQFVQQAPQPIIHQVAQPFLHQVQQPIPLNIQPSYKKIYLNQTPTQQIAYPPQSNPPIIIRNSVPKQNSAISFKTIPVQNTQHSIILPGQGTQPSTPIVFNQTPEIIANYTQPRRSSIFRTPIIVEQKPIQQEAKQMQLVQVNKQPNGNLQFKNTQSKIETVSGTYGQVNPFFFKNAANFSQIANFQAAQGQSSMSMSKQQKNQQSVSFSSKTQQISTSSTQQNYTKTQKTNQKQINSSQQQANNQGSNQISITSQDQN